MAKTQKEKAEVFRTLHERDGAFIIPNPWDIGSARLLAAMGFEPLGPMSPSEFGRYIASETAKWSKIIKEAAIDLQQ